LNPCSILSDRVRPATWGPDAPAVLDGYGPIPTSPAQRLVAEVAERSLATLRRLYRHPKNGWLVAVANRKPLLLRTNKRKRSLDVATSFKQVA
jgi:hypothetical protein